MTLMSLCTIEAVCIMPRLHLIDVARIKVVSNCIICIACRHLHCILYRRHVSTCIRIQVARPCYLYPATSCIWCKRGLMLCSSVGWMNTCSGTRPSSTALIGSGYHPSVSGFPTSLSATCKSSSGIFTHADYVSRRGWDIIRVLFGTLLFCNLHMTL